jgi:putative peptidoglycan lipid II flippase
MSSTMGRAALVVSGGILLSRLLGFVREVVLAALLGRTIEADLYTAAFAIPDFLFFLMAGGYLTITFVPIITRHLASGDTAEANRSFTAVARVVAGLMLIVTGATMLFARPLTERFFPLIPDERIPELVGLVRIILPAQFFFVVGSLLMAVQYAHRRFLVPTLAPLVYNIGIIAGGVASWAMGDPSPAGFIWGALGGAVAGNFALQWWGARRLGLRLVAGAPLGHGAVPEYFSLAFPLMIGQSAVGLDEVFLRVFGQLGGEGGIAALNYARRLNMVPVGVIAQAAGVASYPFLARLFAEDKMTELRETVMRAVRSSVVVAGLGAAGVVGLALPIVQVAYQRGQFDPPDTAATATLLAIYGLSIPMWAVHQIYTRGFYAQRRMWLPVGVGTASTVFAVPLYLYAGSAWGAEGVAWSSVIVMAVYSAVMAWWWHRSAPVAGVGASLGRMLAAALPAGAAGWAVAHGLMGGSPAGTGVAVAALVGGSVVTVGVYWLVLRSMRAPELAELRR